MNVDATTMLALSAGASSIQRFVFCRIVGGTLGIHINLSYAARVRLTPLNRQL